MKNLGIEPVKKAPGEYTGRYCGTVAGLGLFEIPFMVESYSRQVTLQRRGMTWHFFYRDIKLH